MSGCTLRSQPHDKIWNPGRNGATSGATECPGGDEGEGGIADSQSTHMSMQFRGELGIRSITGFAHMQTPEVEKLMMIPGTVLAHMQTLDKGDSGMRFGKEIAHTQAPVEEDIALRFRTAEPPRESKEATSPDVRVRSSGVEHSVKCAEPSSVHTIMAIMASYFAPGEKFPEAEMRDIVEDAQEVADTNYGVPEAVEWAEGYEFPKDMLANDLRSFEESNRDFEGMVRTRLKTLQPSRLNLERISRLSPDNPEKDLLCDLSVGMRVPIPVGFSPNGTGVLTPLRASYQKVH